MSTPTPKRYTQHMITRRHVQGAARYHDLTMTLTVIIIVVMIAGVSRDEIWNRLYVRELRLACSHQSGVWALAHGVAQLTMMIV